MQTDDYLELGLTHQIHTSESRSFRSCRRRWNWVHHELWYPKKTPRPLEFGIAYHKAMEVYYEPSTWSLPRDVIANTAIQEFKDTTEQQFKTFVHRNGGIGADESVKKDYLERVELGVGMLKHHLYTVAPELDKGLKPLYVEIKFELPIGDGDLRCFCALCHRKWTRSDAATRSGWAGLPVTYGGRIDALMQRVSDGRQYVFDWKTAGNLSRDNDAFLQTDCQIARYLWAMWKLGIDIAGFIYHEQKKAFPQPPRQNAKRYRGALFSLDKRQDTNYELYLKTVQENDTQAYNDGVYDDFLRSLQEREEPYFQRYVITKNDYELRMIENTIYMEAQDMIDPGIKLYPNPGKFHCNNCAFIAPCVGMNKGEDYEYTLETMYDKGSKQYWEEEPLSTEKAL